MKRSRLTFRRALALAPVLLAASVEAAQAGPGIPLFTIFAGGAAYTFALPSLVVGLLLNAASAA
ncbi:hypothetical protein, partial [Rhodobacter lacus]